MEDATIICRCEEVTFGDVRAAMDAGLLEAGDIRRCTRAGMGSCQGRSCQRLLMQLIKRRLSKDVIAEDTIHIRAPIQPVSAGELANWK